MSAFQSGNLSATTSTPSKLDLPAGDYSVVLQGRGGVGVNVGHNSAVGYDNVYLANGDTITLLISVPAGETASIWFRSVSGTSKVAYFVGTAA